MKTHLLLTFLFAASAGIGVLGCSAKNADTETTDDPVGGGSSFNEVYAILQARCVKCHTPNADGGAASGGLVLTPKAEAYANLVNKPAAGGKCRDAGAESEPRIRVKPEDPDESLLLQKVKATHDCGDRMPLPASAATLTAAQIATITSWIENGALNPP